MSNAAVLERLKNGEISVEEASKLLDEKPEKPLTCKVSEKGAVSVYGLQRMPVTLYVGQWERLTEFIPALTQFCKDNDAKLKRK